MADPDFWTCVLIAAFGAACLGLSAGKDLWLDELFTWYQVKDKSFAGLRAATATGFNLMPLGHFSLLWAMDKVGLLTVWTARLVSMGAAVGGVWVMVRLWRRWWGHDVALLLTGILVGTSAPLLTMAVEVRPYALVFLFAAVALNCGRRFMEGETHWRLWGLNAGCSFALPFVSYPAGAYSAALALGVILTCGRRRLREAAIVLASYAAGWALFLVAALDTLVEQMHSNPIGIRNPAPHVPDVFGIYSALVWFPLAIVVALEIAVLLPRRSGGNTDEAPTERAGPTSLRPVSLAVLFWLLVPLGFFLLAKIGGPTIWGERFFLPTAAALVTLAGPLLAAFWSRHSFARQWPTAVGLAASVSVLAMTSTFWRANRDAPVRRFPAQLTAEITSLPIVVREMNTYFHLLYYGDGHLDLRLYADNRMNAQLLSRVSLRFKPAIDADLWHLSDFAVLVDRQAEWTDRIAAELSRHHLTIAQRYPVSNEFIQEIWVVRKAP